MMKRKDIIKGALFGLTAALTVAILLWSFGCDALRVAKLCTGIGISLAWIYILGAPLARALDATRPFWEEKH